MPYFRVLGDQLSIKAGGEDGSHLKDIVSSMAYLRHEEEYTDLVFHCSNGVKLRGNKSILASLSGFVHKIVSRGCECCGNQSQIPMDLICPDFSPKALKKVLEMLYTGETRIASHERCLFDEMKDIMRSLQFDLKYEVDTSPFIECQNDSVEERASSSENENEAMDPVDSFDPPISPVQEDQGTTVAEVGTNGNDPDESSDYSHRRSNYKCTICGKSFHMSIALKKHLLKHAEVSTKQLTSCGPKDLTPSGQSGMDIVSTNSTGSDGLDEEELDVVNTCNSGSDEEEENLAGFVGIPCPLCDELYRRKDLSDHIQNCSGKSDSSDEDNSQSEINENKSSQDISKSKIVITSRRKPDVANCTKSAKISCHICAHKMSRISNFKTHMGVNHYEKELSKFFGKDNACSLCQKKNASKRLLISHLVLYHKALDKIISSKAFAKTGNVPPKKKKKSQSLTKKKTAKVSAVKVDKYRCYRCPSRFESRPKLFRHIACSHFRKKLTERYQKDEHQCNICDIQLATYHSFLSHISNTHEVLNDYVSAEDLYMAKDRSAPKRGLVKTKSASPRYDGDEASHSNNNKTPAGDKNDVVTDDVTRRNVWDPKHDEPKYQCHICGDKFISNRVCLLGHYANVHYLGELQEVHLETDVCTICKTSGDFNEGSSMLHYVIRHEGLKGFIPDMASLQIGTSQNVQINLLSASQKEGTESSDQNTSESNKDIVEPAKSLTWFCHFCPKTFAKPHRLAWHLANIHFRNALLKRNNPKNPNRMICTLCCLPEPRNRYGLIRHLCYKHDALKDFLPFEIYQKLLKHGGFLSGARKPRVPATSRAIPNFDEASNTNEEIRRPEEN